MSFIDDVINRSASGTARMEEFAELNDKVTAVELTEMLKKGIVKFQYKKKDGKTIRVAFGTKNSDLITKIPHDGDCPPKRAGYTIYFDVEKGDFRAFDDRNIMGVYGTPMTYDQYEEYKNIK